MAFLKTKGEASLRCIVQPDGSSFWFLELRSDADEDKYISDLKKVKECPIEELPLFIGTIFEPIVRERLK